MQDVDVMSKIYDALIKLESKKRPRPRSTFSGIWRNDKVGSLKLWWTALSLESQIAVAIAAVVLVFGLLLVAIVNQLIGRALRTQIDQRAFMMATNLSDAAAGQVIARNTLELYALLTKYARLDGVAYAFIEDNNGEIVAHTFSTFPPEIRDTLTANERKQFYNREVRWKGKTIHETRTPILEGQIGAAHIGIWQESVTAEIRKTLLPLVALITMFFVAGVVLSVFLARGIIRWLTDMTGMVSSDDLDTSVKNRVME